MEKCVYSKELLYFFKRDLWSNLTLTLWNLYCFRLYILYFLDTNSILRSVHVTPMWFLRSGKELLWSPFPVVWSVCLSVKKMSKLIKQRNLTWSWKQKMSARLSRPLISSLDILLCLYVGRSTRILNNTYPWPHIPGALCSPLLVLVFFSQLSLHQEAQFVIQELNSKESTHRSSKM